MPYKHSKKTIEFRRIARERIGILFEQAKLRYKEDPKLSDRYVQLARKIAMRHKIRISPEFKRRICKNCRKFLVPGKNLRIRSHKGRTIYYCLECKHFMRFPNR